MRNVKDIPVYGFAISPSKLLIVPLARTAVEGGGVDEDPGCGGGWFWGLHVEAFVDSLLGASPLAGGSLAEQLWGVHGLGKLFGV